MRQRRLALETTPPPGEFGGERLCFGQWQVEPSIRSVDTVLRDPLAAELGVSVVLMTAPAGDVGESVSRFVVHPRPRVEPRGVAERHAGPVDGQIAKLNER
ncbi:hypothetical protein ACIQCF_00375 [Streptomyces sp. NPDC088353]|uniref:hypothetical protein n=1 Tax=Streptomyces sp. NPDC088353 TaxID=3365855 RepID=UPI0037FCE984